MPKLTQLQARFAACLGASMTLVIIYLVLTSPHLAYAHDLNDLTTVPLDAKADDHNWFRIQELQGDITNTTAYAAGNLAARQASDAATRLPGNNSPGNQIIDGGRTQQWLFASQYVNGPHGRTGSGLPGAFVDFRGVVANGTDQNVKRQAAQAAVTIYISVNVCSQPSSKGESPPQLVLYATTGSTAGPSAPSTGQQRVPLVEGYAATQISATGDARIAIEAPALPSGATGRWSYSVAASIDNFYHQANVGLPPLYLVDTDTSSALLITDNLTQAEPSSQLYSRWMNITPPFTLFSAINSTALNGLRSSFCALSTASNITAAIPRTRQDPNSAVQMSMINRGLGHKPKQQFYLRGLQGDQSYQAFLAMTGNSTASGAGVVGGGGRVYRATNFTTKSHGNCALIYNLTFCNEVAYSVPSNPVTYPNTSLLGPFYDDYASKLYTNFSLSLQLVPCKTEPAAQYSLTKTCDDCAAAYKSWICSVTIPRCVDFSASTATLMDPSPQLVYYPRNVAQPFPGNGSTLPDDALDSPWNPMPGAPSRSSASQQVLRGALASRASRVGRIDDVIQPGPYRELLPCEDLCYDLVRNCPASLGFGCPPPGRGLEAGYARRDALGRLSCNYAGAVDYRSAGRRAVSAPLVWLCSGLAVAAMLPALW